MFAKPFLGQMGQGHVDGVYSMAKDPTSLKHIASGSGDGILKVWDLTSRDEIFTTTAHEVGHSYLDPSQLGANPGPEHRERHGLDSRFKTPYLCRR